MTNTVNQSPSSVLRKAVGLGVHLLRQAGDSPEEVRRKILDAIKEATRSKDIPTMPTPAGDATNLVGIFRMVMTSRWLPMDDRKAERFYAVGEDCIGHWLAIPDLTGKVEIPELRESLARLDVPSRLPVDLADLPEVDPGPAGAEGLAVWIENFRDILRSHYREARRRGEPEQLILITSPMVGRTDVGPDNMQFLPWANRAAVLNQIPNLSLALSLHPPKGYFYVLATRGTGRLKGSIAVLLEAPGDWESLPATGAVKVSI